MNAGEGPLARSFHTGLAAGRYCDVVTGGRAPIARDACSGTAARLP